MENVGQKRFEDFDLKGRVFIVTGGASGLGLAMAEALVEAGGKVYCIDRAESPHEEWKVAQQRVRPEFGGSLQYCRGDVSEAEKLTQTVDEIAAEHERLDGMLAAAGIMQEHTALDWSKQDAMRLMSVNFHGVFTSATAAARAMMRYKCRGSICLVASMSGLIANKGMESSVYNASKAALIQLARNLAMEWTPIQQDGTGGIRVNCLSPGHVKTPMVAQVLKHNPDTEEKWVAENMMHRLGDPAEFKSAGLFLLSRASSFMTGNNLVIDGGHTAW